MSACALMFLCICSCIFAAVLWCFGSHIYGVSEGQWRLLPGTARRLCREVNVKPNYLIRRETCVTVLTLAGSGLERGRPQQSTGLDGVKKSFEVHCPRRPSVFTRARGPALFCRIFVFVLSFLHFGSYLFFLVVSTIFFCYWREIFFLFHSKEFKAFSSSQKWLV